MKTHFSGATTWDNWTDVYLDWLPPYGVPALYHENDANQDIKQTSICAGYTGLVYIFYKHIGWTCETITNSDMEVLRNVSLTNNANIVINACGDILEHDITIQLDCSLQLI